MYNTDKVKKKIPLFDFLRKFDTLLLEIKAI